MASPPAPTKTPRDEECMVPSALYVVREKTLCAAFFTWDIGMKKGDTLAKVASRYRISQTRLKQINGITPRVRVRPGFTLLVPRPGGQANPDLLARALPKEAPPKATKKKRSIKKKKKKR